MPYLHEHQGTAITGGLFCIPDIASDSLPLRFNSEFVCLTSLLS